MPESRYFTFVFGDHGSSRVRRFSISRTALLGLGSLGVAALVGAAAGAYHYTRMALKVTDHSSLLAENNAFRAENQNYRIQTAQLGEKLDALETLSRRLRIVSGLDAAGGQGGISSDSMAKPVSPAAGTLVAIDRYNRQVGELDERLRGVRDSLYESVLLTAAQPAFLPVKGYVTGGLGKREDPFTGSSERHTGIDISAPYGSRVTAPADGTVVYAGTRAGYGNVVVIDHRFGVTTRYGHLWKLNAEAGQHVSRHEVIGYVGTTGRTTGPHLHYELWVHGRSVDPIRYIREAASRAGLPQVASRLP